MGWKISALLISPPERLPRDDALGLVGVAPAAPFETGVVEAVLYPDDDMVAVAEYDAARALFSCRAIGALAGSHAHSGCVPGTGPHDALGERLRRASRGGRIAYVALQSVVNYYALVLWEDGALRRALAGSADRNDGLPWLNEGGRLPSEPEATYDETKRLLKLRPQATESRFRKARAAFERADPDAPYPACAERIILDLFLDFIDFRLIAPYPAHLDWSRRPARIYKSPPSDA